MTLRRRKGKRGRGEGRGDKERKRRNEGRREYSVAVISEWKRVLN